MTVILKRDKALSDLRECGEFLGSRSLSLELRFYDAAEKTFQFLAENAGIGRLWDSDNPKLKDVRLWRIKGFENWLIFYRRVPDGIEILRVLHGARELPKQLDANV